MNYYSELEQVYPKGQKLGWQVCIPTGEWDMASGPPAPATGSADQDTLQNRANMIEAELSAIKDQLKNQSE